MEMVKAFLVAHQEETDMLVEVTPPFFETVKYVLVDIACLPKDMRIFQSGSFYYILHNVELFVVERLASDTEVLFQCVYKYNLNTGERLNP